MVGTKTIVEDYRGQDLIDMGFKPSKWFGEALREINSIKDIKSSEAFKIAKKHFEENHIEVVDPDSKVVTINLAAETPEEKENYNRVLEVVDNLIKHPKVKEFSILPDACPTGDIYSMPVGTVASVVNAIVPSFHSADLACSLMVSYIDDYYDPSDPLESLDSMLDSAETNSAFGIGFNPTVEFDAVPNELEDRMRNNIFLEDLINLSRDHIGTQGDGNHFVTIGVGDKTDAPCIVSHFGSRGLGAALYRKGEAYAKKLSGLKRNAYIPLDTTEGQEYLEALNIVYEWTYLNHKILHHSIVEDLSLNITSKAFCSHNMVFKDHHKDNVYNHVKGVTAMYTTEGRETMDKIIPINMADPILVVRQDPIKFNMYAPHGAGRNISRSEFLKKYTEEELIKLFEEETQNIQYIPYLGEPDYTELPSAYKDFETIFDSIDWSVDIQDYIIPFGTIMAGKKKQY